MIRGNFLPLRQIESDGLSALAYTAAVWQIDQHDPGRSCASPDCCAIQTLRCRSSRGAYVIVDRRTSDPIARLRPIPNTDRFELFYWSNTDGRWRTFGNFGRMKLMLESAREIVENDPMYRVPRAR